MPLLCKFLLGGAHECAPDCQPTQLLIEARICEVGCGTAIVPMGSARLLVEDAGTRDEYRGWMHQHCYDERMAMWAEIRDVIDGSA